MSDAAVLKKEIKAWEHEFKAKHGRGPKVPDIKANTAIGAFPTRSVILPLTKHREQVQGVEETKQSYFLGSRNPNQARRRAWSCPIKFF